MNSFVKNIKTRRIRRRKQHLSVLIYLLFIASGTNVAHAIEGRVLSVTVWATDLGPRVEKSTEELTEEVRERARVAMSGLVYGYSFDYTLSNNARQIEERFQLQPISEIAPDDPRLTARDVWREGNFLYTQFTYPVTDEQDTWVSAWEDDPSTVNIGGIGEEKFQASEDEQQKAIENAVRQSILNYLQATERNKPKQVRGNVLFRQSARLWIDSGAYWADVKLYLRIHDIIEFQVY